MAALLLPISLCIFCFIVFGVLILMGIKLKKLALVITSLVFVLLSICFGGWAVWVLSKQVYIKGKEVVKEQTIDTVK